MEAFRKREAERMKILEEEKKKKELEDIMNDPKRKAALEKKQKEEEEKALIVQIPRFTPEFEKPDLTDNQFEENVEFGKVLDGMPSFKQFDDFAQKYQDVGKVIQLL